MDFLPGRPGGAGDGRGTTIHALVGEQARRTPAAPAVVAPDGELDYAELVLRARGLARRLSDCVSDQGPDTAPNTPMVGVCLERSLELPVALLGVLEAGAAYLPLDPAYPEQRLAHMLADSGAVAVVCSARTEAAVRGAGVRCVLVGEGESEGGASARERDDVDPALLPAYVIYTSGSTGEPKGVVVPHSALVNHARANALVGLAAVSAPLLDGSGADQGQEGFLGAFVGSGRIGIFARQDAAVLQVAHEPRGGR